MKIKFIIVSILLVSIISVVYAQGRRSSYAINGETGASVNTKELSANPTTLTEASHDIVDILYAASPVAASNTAIKYSVKGKTVTITAIRHDPSSTFTVTDGRFTMPNPKGAKYPVKDTKGLSTEPGFMTINNDGTLTFVFKVGKVGETKTYVATVLAEEVK